MRRLMLMLACLTVGTVAAAQTVPLPSPIPSTYYLAFEHDGVGMGSEFSGRFELVIDGGAPGVIAPQFATAVPALAGKPGIQPTTRVILFPPLTPGQHTLIVRACNTLGCEASVPFAVVLIPAVSPAANVRFVIGS